MTISAARCRHTRWRGSARRIVRCRQTGTEHGV